MRGGSMRGRQMVREFAIRRVLELYPPHLRARYGEEIADLLRRSPTPARDLANAAWTATAERTGGVTPMGVGRTAARLIGLLLVPTAVVASWLAAHLLSIAVFGSGPITYYLVPTLLVIPPAAWLAWRQGRRRPITLPEFAIPMGLAAGTLAFAAIPGPGTMLGERWDGTAFGLTLWLAGMVVIGQPRIPWLAKVLLAPVVLDVAIIGFVLAAIPGSMAPLNEAHLWYPLGLIGLDGDSVLARTLLHDQLKFLPGVLTVLTVVALTRLYSTTSDSSAASLRTPSSISSADR